MDVIVSKEVPDEVGTEQVMQLVSAATQHQSMVLPAGDECWELVAYIVPNEQAPGVLVQFALREVDGLTIRALVGKDENAEPLAVEEVIGMGQACIPEPLYLTLAEQIVYATEEWQSQLTSTTNH